MKQALFLATIFLSVSALAAESSRPPITGVSHIAVYAANPAATEHFYVHDLGGFKAEDVENGQGTRYYFSPSQYVEVLPLPQGQSSSNRLDHVAFTTSDAERLRTYLLTRAIGKPGALNQGRDGSGWFDVVDPEGNRIQFVQGPKHQIVVHANPLSSRIIHVGFIVHDRAREDTFFRDVLGFKPYWYGGFQENAPTWISQQVPDGTDWLEYMIAGEREGHGIPPDMKPSDVGILNHFSLGVVNVESAYTRLWNGDRLAGQDGLPKIGRDAKWQLNLLDPEGTRAEIMELHAIGKPCCSSFTASDPK
jgi:catechol 2,3-dioxygenase-like lactoylglutathione lyase family enzyme